MSKFPSNEDIQDGMKVLVELKKDRGTGKLTEGIVKRKLSNAIYDDNGIVVVLEKDQQEIEQQGRVHKIIDPNFIEKKNSINHIELLPGEFYSSRKKIIELLTTSEDFMWFFLGYFRHNHFDFLKEVLENNKNIKEIKIITLIQRKNQKNLFELLLENGHMFKKEYSDVDIQIKIINDKDVGLSVHNRYYFTKNKQYDFIDFEIAKMSQRTEIQLLDQNEFENNSERDFKQYWNLETAFDIFNKNHVNQLLEYFD